ncbi:hypothetical protein F4803DRAFT_383871 [Xylaria telfairii]|nr:hypothetical protein F4803DRAFT_383871 [Xylaria telfairii]
MLEQGFKNIDALVYDTPFPPLGLHKKKHIESGNPYHMSGALSTNPGPSQVRGSPTDNKFKGTNQSAEKDEEGNSALNQFGSDNKDRNENQSTPSPPGFGSRDIPMPSSTSQSSSRGENSGEGGKLVQNGARPSSHHVQRETPIPAPQPWTGLGILDPFNNHLLRTPTNRNQPIPASQSPTGLGIPDPFYDRLLYTPTKQDQPIHSILNPYNDCLLYTPTSRGQPHHLETANTTKTEENPLEPSKP